MAIEVNETFPAALLAHRDAVNQLCIDGNPSVADEQVEKEVALYRGRFLTRNETPAPPDVVELKRAEYQVAYDTGLKARTEALTREHTEYGHAIEAAIEASLVLATYIELNPDDDMKAVRYLLERERAEKAVDGLTYTQLGTLYRKTTDARDRTLVALIERDLDRVVLRDDPDHDALAIMQLREAIAARQAARVPQWLRDAQTHYAEIRTLNFNHLRKHLIVDQRAVAGR